MQNKTYPWVRLFICCLLLISATISFAQSLVLGMPAPPIKVGKWVKGAPINEFKLGNIYVVDFWATWCGWCIKGFPELNRIAKKYNGKVTVIGIDVWESNALDGIPLVNAMGDKMDYRVAIDSWPSRSKVTNYNHMEGFMSKAWL